MSSPIPIIVCGKIASHRTLIPEFLKPEYEGVYSPSKSCSSGLCTDRTPEVLGGEVIPTVEIFLERFPGFFESSTKKPVAIFMGGGFDRQEFENAYAAPGASSIPWLRPIRTKPGNDEMARSAGDGPPAEKVAEAARSALEVHDETIKAGEGAGEIWYY